MLVAARRFCRSFACMLLAVVSSCIPVQNDHAAGDGRDLSGNWKAVGDSSMEQLATGRGTRGHVRGGAFQLPHPEQRGVDWLSVMNRLHERGRTGVQPGPEWDFVPELVATVVPGDAAKWEAPCFSATSLVETTPVQEAGGTVVSLKISLTGRTGVLCEDAYLLATPWRYLLLDEALSGSHVERWGPMGSEELEDLQLAGIRVFRFPNSIAESLVDLYDTAKLFYSGITGPAAVPKELADRNRKFLQKYAHIEMPPRSAPAKPVTLDPQLVESGDMFGVVRLDGLDPLIMWGTGSHLGHTAIALRDPTDNALHICESQSQSNYWPTDRIQCHLFAEWFQLAALADYNVLWMPLGPVARAHFDAAAAWEERGKLLGLLYGFPNLLFGWIDTPASNFPPPLSAELLAAAFALAEPLYARLSPAPSLINGALRHRLAIPAPNATGDLLSTAQLLLLARRRGLSAGALLALPEQDAWSYPGRAGAGGWPAGPAVVCNVFVCRVWKAGGLLPPGANCAEFTPFDTYELSLFHANASALPAHCRREPPAADGAPFCQILGAYHISLPHANSAPAPFAGMRERCPTTPPDYADRVASATSC